MLIAVSGGGTYLFAAVGFCGSFTTFSTFSAQALQLFQSGQRVMGLCYVLGSVALFLIAVAFGVYYWWATSTEAVCLPVFMAL